MTILLWLVLGVLALKLIWNLGVPFVLLKRLRENPESQISGISMATVVEIALLLVAIGLSAMVTGESWVNRPLAVAGWGVTAIVFTYIHLGIIGAIGGWFIMRNRPSTSSSSPQSLHK
jgi:Kef-type K+ transport system membrane component KefB